MLLSLSKAESWRRTASRRGAILSKTAVLSSFTAATSFLLSPYHQLSLLKPVPPFCYSRFQQQRYFTVTSAIKMTAAPFPYNTYDSLPAAPSFTVTSTDIEDGGTMPPPQLSKAFGVEGGEDCSPQLSWEGFPAETKSFVVTCYDPDAPTVSGFWHWIVYDIPASTTSLVTNAGNPDKSNLPEGAKMLKNDAGFAGFCGSAPPPGHGNHRYIFCVSALPIEALPIDESSTSPSVCQFNMFGAGVLARAFLTATYGR